MRRRDKYYDSIYNEEIDRLGDVLIPLPVFNDMVEYVEGTNSFEVSYSMRYDGDVESHNATASMRIMPYPYTTGIAYSEPIVKFAEQLRVANGIDEKTKEIMIGNAISNAIANRISTFAQNMVETSLLEKLDADPDVGCILHISTGNMIFYHFSCVDDLEVIQLDSMIPRVLNAATMRDESRERELHNIRLAHSYGPRYRHLYRFHYTRVDELNPTGEPIFGTITDSATIELENSAIISENIVQRFKAHQKVILTA